MSSRIRKKHVYNATYPEFLKHPVDADWTKRWFTEHEILYIKPEDQRVVILNPGRKREWFRKVYPITGEVIHTKMVFNKEFPRKCEGKIIAVSAIPKYKDKIHGGIHHGEKFRDVKDSIPYETLSELGLLKAKPIGTFYELFESASGYRVWTNPSEYISKKSRRRRK